MTPAKVKQWRDDLFDVSGRIDPKSITFSPVYGLDWGRLALN